MTRERPASGPTTDTTPVESAGSAADTAGAGDADLVEDVVSRADEIAAVSGQAGPPITQRPQKALIDVLRFFGLACRLVPRPVIGKKAYVRWWERLRAAFLLGAIVIVLGFLVAAIIGIAVLAAGFLLEQAIS